jgi:ParB family transcriptional regulator, chromosome partitioning protein
VTKDRRLGRGLAALLGSPMEEGQTGDETTATVDPAESSSIRVAPGTQRESKVTGAVPLNSNDNARIRTLELNVDEIENNPFQPRRKFNEEEIASLAASIKEHKQLQPILVRKVGEKYQLISGERRLRATIHAGLKTIRAELRQADDRLVAELAIVENLQRKDLDAIEKALSFRRYLNEHRCTQDEFAKRLKIDRSTIANLMRLLELPTQIQEWIQSDKITAGHARSLLPLGDENQQMIFAKHIIEHGWSVRETERHVAEQLEREDGVVEINNQPKISTRKRVMTPQIASLEQKMRLSMGTKVEIRQSVKGNGRITIQFSNPAEFERLCQLICPDRKTAAA